jgi:hypothetical protein
VVRKNRSRNKRDHEDVWPQPTLRNFSTNPEPYYTKDGKLIDFSPPKEKVVLKIHKPSVEELLGLKKPEE